MPRGTRDPPKVEMLIKVSFLSSWSTMDTQRTHAAQMSAQGQKPAKAARLGRHDESALDRC